MHFFYFGAIEHKKDILKRGRRKYLNCPQKPQVNTENDVLTSHLRRTNNALFIACKRLVLYTKVYNTDETLFFACGEEELGGVKDILPDDIRCRSKGCHGIEIRIRHPDSERGVFLSESLSGGDGRDALHSRRSRGRIDEDILVVTAFAGSREIPSDEFAEAELQQASEERTY